MQPSIITIFGVTGDLSHRYLLPALYQLFRLHLLDDSTWIIGLSRREISLDDIFQRLADDLSRNGDAYDSSALQLMRSRTKPYQLDMDDPAAYHRLRKNLDDLENDSGVCMNRLYYLSIPPSAYATTIRLMGQAKLNQGCEHGQGQARLLVEKPFGRDVASAEELINLTAETFQESQVFRIDHYLAKETAQNIITFRFENPLFEAVWNNRHVSSIDITASEKIGIEGRAAFYEQQGALRDFIQNHLLQLLAIVTMDEPDKLDSDSIHAMKLRLLEAIEPVEPQDASRGQYEGYRQEVSNPESSVETYASITTGIDNNRWRGVPITIRTGKALAERKTVITLTFKNDSTGLVANTLQFRIQPDEGIALNLLAKKPGFEHELLPVAMNFSYDHHFDSAHPAAYERVLLDAVKGDRTLFTGSQEVLAAWRVVEPVVQDWQQHTEGLHSYKPGTSIQELP